MKLWCENKLKIIKFGRNDEYAFVPIGKFSILNFSLVIVFIMQRHPNILRIATQGRVTCYSVLMILTSFPSL